MKNWKKTTAAILAGTLVISTGAASVHAANSVETEKKSAEITVSDSESTVLTAAASGKEGADTLSKDETVYVLTGADGTPMQIIVSDHLTNGTGLDRITDISGLTGIENVKGDEDFETDADGSTVWNAGGKDIYYTGSTEAELPLGLTVTYLLDGEEIAPEDLAGKSGHVTIRYEYENRMTRTALVDGKEEEMHVPFAVLTGMILSNDVFTNVEVTNGHILNDGDRTIAVGVALPGIREDLRLKSDVIDIPEYFELSADVTDFSLGITMTVATDSIFSELSGDDPDKLGDLTDSMDSLTDAMEQLMQGSSDLYDGLTTLREKTGELADGTAQLNDGAAQLADGTESLYDGTTRVKDGVSSLNAGLAQLTNNNAALQGGAKQVFESLLAMGNKEIAASGLTVPTMTIDNYASVLNGVIASLDSTTVYQQALQQVTAAVEAQRSVIRTAVTDAVRTQVEAQVRTAVEAQVRAQVTAALQAQYGTDVDAAIIDAAVAQQMESDAVLAMITANTDAQMASEAIQATINANTETQVQKAIADNMASDAVQTKLAQASAGAQSLISLKASLDSYNSFYLGLMSYTDGVASAAAGAKQLESGVDSLNSGAAKLKDGAETLADGTARLAGNMPALTEGVNALTEGSGELKDGLEKFNEEGIRKLTDLVNEDLAGVYNRLKALSGLAEEYNNFSGIAAEMDGQVKFIYRTAEIKNGK